MENIEELLRKTSLTNNAALVEGAAKLFDSIKKQEQEAALGRLQRQYRAKFEEARDFRNPKNLQKFTETEDEFVAESSRISRDAMKEAQNFTRDLFDRSDRNERQRQLLSKERLEEMKREAMAAIYNDQTPVMSALTGRQTTRGQLTALLAQLKQVPLSQFEKYKADVQTVTPAFKNRVEDNTGLVGSGEAASFFNPNDILQAAIFDDRQQRIQASGESIRNQAMESAIAQRTAGTLYEQGKINKAQYQQALRLSTQRTPLAATRQFLSGIVDASSLMPAIREAEENLNPTAQRADAADKKNDTEQQKLELLRQKFAMLGMGNDALQKAAMDIFKTLSTQNYPLAAEGFNEIVKAEIETRSGKSYEYSGKNESVGKLVNGYAKLLKTKPLGALKPPSAPSPPNTGLKSRPYE